MAEKKDINKKGTKKKNQVKKVDNKKQESKSGKKVSESEKVEKQLKERFNENGELQRLFKIVLIVTAIFAMFYVVTIVVTNKSSEKKAELREKNMEVEKAEIQYENIMIGTMLNFDGTYYVLISKKDESRETEYSALVDSIKANEDSPNIYKANLTDSFNKVYLANEENYYVSDISEFAVTGTVLVKVVDGKIDSVMDNYNDIKNKLNELA